MPSLAPDQLQRIKDLLAAGEVRQAIDSLLNMLKQHADAALVFEEALVLSGELAQHEEAVRKGLADDSINNAISFRLLQILNQLDASKKQQHSSRIADILAELRQEMLRANMSNSKRDIHRLSMRITTLVGQFPDSFELLELKEQIEVSLGSYQVPAAPAAGATQSSRTSFSRITWVLPVLLLAIVAAVFIVNLPFDDTGDDMLIAAVIDDEGIQLKGVEPFMEREDCQQLIALAEEINEDMEYQNELSLSLNGESITRGPSQTLEGDYSLLYDALRKERSELGQSIKQLENQLVDSIQKAEIQFDYNSAALPKTRKKTLDKIAVLLKKNPNWKINISGHTDDVGSEDFNQRLSIQRADSTADYLIKKGVGREQIESSSHGESRPKRPNTTDQGRAVNRRSELEIERPDSQ